MTCVAEELIVEGPYDSLHQPDVGVRSTYTALSSYANTPTTGTGQHQHLLNMVIIMSPYTNTVSINTY